MELSRRQGQMALLAAGAFVLAPTLYAYSGGAQLDVMVFVAIAAVVLFAQPTATFVLALIVAQELSGAYGFGQEYPLLALGHELYFTEAFRLPLVEVIAVVGAVVALVWSGGLLPRARVVVRAAGAVGVVLFLLAYFASDMSVVSSLGAPIRPAVLVACGVMLASTVESQAGGWRRVAAFASVGFVFELGIGLFALATGQSPRELAVFYDSALPAFAAAVVLALFAIRPNRAWMYAAAPLAIVLLSGRRSVWAAVLVASLMVIVVRTQKTSAILRGAAAALILGGVVWMVGPALTSSIVERVGTGVDTSTAGHLEDIRLGWQYGREAPFWGYGFNHGPLPGLVVQGSLYVHNEPLLVWLRFGLAGLLLSVGVFAVTMRATLGALRSSSEMHRVIGGVLVWLTPVCCMTAPFLSTTSRWPLLFGVALGAALLGNDKQPPAEARGVVEKVSKVRV